MKSKGISLIVLVITILVLSILAATVVISLSNTNIIGQAGNAVTKNNVQSMKEAINLEVASNILSNGGNVEISELQETLIDKGYTVEVAGQGLKVTKDGIILRVSNKGTIQTGSLATEIYDANIGGSKEGYKADKLQIGDFVDYDAGDWGKTVTLSVVGNTPNATAGAGYTGESKPTVGFSFGGFAPGASKNGNAVPYSTSNNYVQTTDNEYVTGWRVFDVDETTGIITLISAGCTEDYYHPYDTNYGYISEYILAGTASMKSYVDAYNATNSTNYVPRNWTADYAGGKGVTHNVTEVAEAARLLTANDLASWYTKYMNKGTFNVSGGTNYLLDNDSTTNGFGVVNGTQYNTLVNNHAFTWLASAYSYNGFHYVSPGYRYVNRSGDFAFGVRPLVHLASNILLENAGTKTLKDAYTAGNTYTYNVWNITGIAE